MTNLRDQMAPLLTAFQNANGRGNLLSANITLMKIVDLLMTHIELQTVQLHMSHEFPASIQRKVDMQDHYAVHGDVDLNVDLSNPDIVAVAEYASGLQDDDDMPTITETETTTGTVVPVKIPAKRGRKPNALKGK